MSDKIELGDEVQCTITGFRGIATSRIDYINTCVRIGVQPPIDKDGKHLDAYYIDEPQLKIVKKKKVSPPEKTAKTGGPTTRIPSQKAHR